MRTYSQYARAAKLYEQEEEWLHAMRLWGMAAGAAGAFSKNGKWALYRVEFCKKVYQRSQIEVDESQQRRLWEHKRELRKREAEEAEKADLRRKLENKLKWRGQ